MRRFLEGRRVAKRGGGTAANRCHQPRAKARPRCRASRAHLGLAAVLTVLCVACVTPAAQAQTDGWHGTMSGRLQVHETGTGIGVLGTPWTSTFNRIAESSATLTRPVPGGVHGSGTGSSSGLQTVIFDGPTSCGDSLGGSFEGSGPLEFDPVVVSIGFINGHWRIGAEIKSVPSIHTIFGGCGNSSTETNDTVWGNSVLPLEIPGSPTDEEIHGTFDAPEWAHVTAEEIITPTRHYVSTAQIAVDLSRKLDTDGDGIPDITELETGSDPYDSNDPPHAGCNGTAEPSVLWPPNHKFRPVSLGSITAPDGDPVDLSVVTVTQDEPLNGLGDGDTSPDATRGPTASQVYLRSERSGLLGGRVYRINYSAVDAKGAVCTGTASVGVPHDIGQGSVPIDSAPPSYNSFGP